MAYNKMITMLIAFLLSAILGPSLGSGIPKGVIGEDQRVLSHDPKVGRIHDWYNNVVCTGTLIGQSCAVTAGHCGTSSLYTIEFNIPKNSFRRLTRASARDKYYIDRSSITRVYNRSTHEDWAVFSIQKHSPISRLERWFARYIKKDNRIDNYPLALEYYPGKMQGFYQISTGPNLPGDKIVITGHGSSRDPRLDKTQRSAEGKLLDKTSNSSPFALFHDSDTTPGSSGSAIISKASGKIIGVHNAFVDHYNRGTSLNLANRFQDAISDCLKREN